ncbi:hypothetical protein Hypma_003150 [Hypsizygus marmoreus]|uniref:Uncharacterized protein n=1 Tax=Hypsizygus marmoreus TaxID=39966 RepID=A0A369K4N2_HYPMA|nr:hypothetical protein Hypma_003150 [Hypsizygus marmoreus]
MGYAPHQTVLDCVRIGRGKNSGSSPTLSLSADNGEVQRGSSGPRMRTMAPFECAMHRVEPSGIPSAVQGGTSSPPPRHLPLDR